MLLIHVVTAISWIGIDIVMGVLIFTAALTDDGYLRMIGFGALGRVIFWPLITVAVLSLASGLVLGWASRYGVLRYAWVLIKLVITVVLALLVIVLLRPTLVAAELAGRAMATGGDVPAINQTQLRFPPIVSGTALLVASWLAVFKPRFRRPTDRRLRPSSRDRRRRRRTTAAPVPPARTGY